MKYYKDINNQVYAYEDDYENIKDGLKPITEKQAMEIANPPPTKEQLILQAEENRRQLLSAADVVMLDWRTELMLEEISDDDRVKLSAWLGYKKDIKAVDVSVDPSGVVWPSPPEE